jgi:hypothetical protein
MAITQEELSVISSWEKWTDAQNMLYHNISYQAFQHLNDRTAKIETLKTEGQWLKRQKEVKQILMQIVGPFPEKTPLNPKTSATIKKNGYRLEKIIFEFRYNL